MEVVQPLVTYKHQYYTHTYIVTLTSTSKIVHWVMRYILTVTFGLFSNFILELLAVKGQANMMGWNGALSGKGSIIFPPYLFLHKNKNIKISTAIMHTNQSQYNIILWRLTNSNFSAQSKIIMKTLYWKNITGTIHNLFLRNIASSRKKWSCDGIMNN